MEAQDHVGARHFRGRRRSLDRSNGTCQKKSKTNVLRHSPARYWSSLFWRRHCARPESAANRSLSKVRSSAEYSDMTLLHLVGRPISPATWPFAVTLSAPTAGTSSKHLLADLI